MNPTPTHQLPTSGFPSQRASNAELWYICIHPMTNLAAIQKIIAICHFVIKTSQFYFLEIFIEQYSEGSYQWNTRIDKGNGLVPKRQHWTFHDSNRRWYNIQLAMFVYPKFIGSLYDALILHGNIAVLSKVHHWLHQMLSSQLTTHSTATEENFIKVIRGLIWYPVKILNHELEQICAEYNT